MLARDARFDDAREADVLAALEQGDVDAALRGLMRLYEQPLYRHCRHLLGDDTLALEALQDTFVQAHRDLPRFARRSPLRCWLFVIARHRCLDLARRRQREGRRQAPLDEVEHQAGVGEDLPATLERRAVGTRLLQCLHGLVPATRDAVLLRFVEDLSYPEMAAICGRRPAALRMCVERALPVLRRCLAQHGVS